MKKISALSKLAPNVASRRPIPFSVTGAGKMLLDWSRSPHSDQTSQM
jgi:hypothetical protein